MTEAARHRANARRRRRGVGFPFFSFSVASVALCENPDAPPTPPYCPTPTQLAAAQFPDRVVDKVTSPAATSTEKATASS